jgi:hypothetical protein
MRDQRKSTRLGVDLRHSFSFCGIIEAHGTWRSPVGRTSLAFAARDRNRATRRWRSALGVRT